MIQDLARQGLDEAQLEAAVGVIAIFNYYTRVADATGIEFDYQTPLPAFEPDLSQDPAPRPGRPGPVSSGPASSGSGAGPGRRRPAYPPFRAAWEAWRGYLLESEEPIGRPERRLLASVAAEETTDWAGAGTLNGPGRPADGDGRLTAFARKLSRQPWRMTAADLAELRAAGYSEQALLHVISVVAHQNADSRLALGLNAVSLA